MLHPRFSPYDLASRVRETASGGSMVLRDKLPYLATVAPRPIETSKLYFGHFNLNRRRVKLLDLTLSYSPMIMFA